MHNSLKITGLIGLVILLCVLTNILILPWYKYEKAEEFPNTPNPDKEIEKMPWYSKVIVAPIIEELIFRSPIYLLLLYFTKHEKENKKLLYLIAILMGVVFAFAHISNAGSYILPSIFCLTVFHGTLFGLLVIKTRELYPSIIAHTGVNVLPLL